MPQYEVTFTFDAANRDEIDFVINRIVENHSPLAYCEPQLVAAEDEIDEDEDDDGEWSE